MSTRDPEQIIAAMNAGKGKEEGAVTAKPFTPRFPAGSIHDQGAEPVVKKEVEAEKKEVEAEKKVSEKNVSKDPITYDEGEKKFYFHQKITTDIRDSKGFKRANIGVPAVVKKKLDMLCTDSDLSWVEYSNLICAYVAERGGIPEDFIKRYKRAIQE